MPSYRYLREIDPNDNKPEPPKDYSKKEKAGNWWHYHWKWVAIGMAIVLLIAFFIQDSVRTPNPDLTIGIVSPYSLPENLVAKLEDGFAAHYEDVNGDGQVLVQIQVYTIQAVQGEADSGLSQSVDGYGQSSSDFMPTDPYAQMAGVTQLSGAISVGEPLLFLADGEQAEAYQEQYAIFGTGQATHAEAGTPLDEVSVLWSDVPALANMDLTFTDLNGNVYDGQEALSSYRIGIRGISERDAERHPDWLDNWAQVNGLLAALGAQV